MPREGVPYPSREICSLKCQIDALQRQINELMKSINGVEGDGQGNVSLLSGDPAIVINNDAVQNQIEIALDQSQLPAAAVSSVNSQTGAVVLEADDIPSDGNSDVQADIDALKALGVNLQGAINNEVTARGNADAALQGNINTLQASIPGEAANAVANDPTVQQLAADVPGKLDKITSGNSLKAYTHTGATQGEKSVVDGTTADSIAIRDANGRLQAADPASGATDKTLVTANWVSQTGNSSPNNLIHKTGNESKSGIFICPEVRQRIYYSTNHVVMGTDLASGNYAMIYKCKITSGTDRNALIMWNNTRKGLPSQVKECGLLSIGGRPTTIQIANIAGTVPSNNFAITRKVNGTNDVDMMLWATGQIKVFDVLFESIGLNSIACIEPGDLSTINDFTSFDEVKYL